MRAALLALCLAAAPAAAQEWVLHDSGELRADHGDWLAVCADGGAGPCRAVQTFADPGSDAYFDGRLALHLGVDGGWTIEVMDRGLPAERVGAMNFTFGTDVVDVPLSAIRPGDIGGGPAADTVTLDLPELTRDLVARIAAAARVTVNYAPSGDGDGVARFSLRGSRAALEAVAARQD
ncbi:hypothetical protein DXV76_03705 [Rhodobacteraceae bacterium CCMM004]|nr:hypothetical protein DXV76_03705 [Rhodobacteraceae bacterium CCMM004]